MNDKGFPDGKPQGDTEKLRAWWGEEVQQCGLSGAVSVEFAPCKSEQPAWGEGKRMLEALVMRNSQAFNVHMYHAAIPGAPWPLETVVMTTDAGVITQVIYHALLKLHLTSGEVKFKKTSGWLSEKLEVEGPGAERFNARKELLNKCKKCLSRRYDPPVRGFLASQTSFELQEASATLQPGTEGSEAIVRTTVASEGGQLHGHKKYSLGLRDVLEFLKAIEPIA